MTVPSATPLPLFPVLPGRYADTGPQGVRIVHYLGSKLRLLGPVCDAVSDVVPRGGHICDLFAGSGAVSLALAAGWNVTSIDIQEYSRVICQGLLRPPVEAPSVAAQVLRVALESSLRARLRSALAELRDYEAECVSRAAGRRCGHGCEPPCAAPWCGCASPCTFGPDASALW